MKCAKVVTLLGKYLDKELETSESIEVRNHLLTCQSCAREFALLKREDEVVRQVFSHIPFDTKLANAAYLKLISSGAIISPKKPPSVIYRYAPVWAACAACLLIATIIISLPSPPIDSSRYTVAKVDESSYLLIREENTEKWFPIASGSELLNKQFVKNPNQKPSSFVTLAGSIVTMREKTIAQLIGTGGTLRINLHEGEIFAHVPHEPLKIVTEESVIVVKGTKFNVKRDNSVTTVTVVEGEVICQVPNDFVTVSSGFQTSIYSDATLKEPIAVDTTSVTDWTSNTIFQTPPQPSTIPLPTQPAKPDNSQPPPTDLPVDQPHSR